MKFKISVIIPVFNVENYISECLDSLVNQTIGIENIEVIIVNDCTQDNSMKIIRDYAEKYPSIKIFEHEINSGQGIARNTGLNHASSDYITFLDSDDFISENTFEVCLEKFENFDCDFVIYEYDYFSSSGKKYPRNPSEKLFKENILIEDITQFPEIIFSMSTCNRVYSKNFKSMLYFSDEKFEDVLVSINTLFSANSICCTKDCKYFYRKRENENKSTMDTYLDKKENYYDHLNINCKIYDLRHQYPDYKYLIDWYNARSSAIFLYKMMNKDIFIHEERKELFEMGKYFLKDVSEDVSEELSVFARNIVFNVKNMSYWEFWAEFKDGDIKTILKELMPIINYVANFKFDDSIKLINTIHGWTELKRKNQEQIELLNKEKSKIENDLKTLNIEKNEIKNQLKSLKTQMSELLEIKGYINYKSNWIAKILKNKFYNYRKSAQDKWGITKIAFIAFISFFYMIKPKNRNIWLFCDRPTEAKDNAYVFFEYVRKNYPNINSYYLIDKNYENDFEKVKKIGNVIEYNSLKHKIYFILSKKLLSSHRGFIEPWDYQSFKKYFLKVTPKKDFIFLQHGIIFNDVRNSLEKRNPRNNLDLFICGAKVEYDHINENYGYLSEEVAYTGLARFDKLYISNEKNQILLMPTWRNGIVQPSWVKKKIVSDEKFLSSEYYQRYYDLINDDELIIFLEKNDINLVFYPHYEVQQYLKYFKSKSNRIIIANKESYDVQNLLLESKLLITDFSSVFFDFAYMEKPIIYYQFDKDYFFNNHYKKGYFSYEKHGFGPITETKKDLIENIKKNIKNNFYMDEKFKKRTRNFFELKDQKNCERIFNEVVKLENKQVILDKLIDNIFKNYRKKIKMAEINVYYYENYLMYVNKSKDKNRHNEERIFLHVFPKNREDLFNKNINFNNLDFNFADFCITNNKSKHKNLNISLIKLPHIPIKNINTGKIVDKGNINKKGFFLRSSITRPLYILYKEKFNLKRAFLNIKAYNVIKNEKLLDINYYLKNSQDVIVSGVDPILHYIYHGYTESRNPNPFFDGKIYLKKHSDVKKSKLNPLVHYSIYGRKEGRKTK